MAVKRNPDGTETIIHEAMPLAEHKHLVQASDFIGALQDTFDIKLQQVSHKQPRVLIETFKVIGTDFLTASDAALYELLLANAKAAGIDRTEYSIDMKPMMEFLSVGHVDRILSSLERITRTVVRYDISDDEIRRRGSIPLIIAELTEEMASTTATLTYTIPDAVRRTILACSEYTSIDLAPMAEFRGRYTPRLYQRLCIRAGYDNRFNRPWKISPQELAEQLGYPDTDRIGEFMKRVVVSGIDEINKHAKRFSVRLDKPVRDKGRGRAIRELSFMVTPRNSRHEELQRAEITSAEVQLIKRPDHVHAPSELPSLRAVTAAAEKTGIAAVKLSNGWRALLDLAKSAPATVLWGTVTGAELLDEIEYGVDEAFKAWVDFLPSSSFVPTHRLHEVVDRHPFTAEAFEEVSGDPVKAAFERRWMKILNAAAEAQEMLEGFRPGSTEKAEYTDAEIAAWLDPRGPLFSEMENDLSTRFDIVRKGLALAALQSGNDLRSTLQHFVEAIRNTNTQRIVGLATELLKSQKKPQQTASTSRVARLASKN